MVFIGHVVHPEALKLCALEYRWVIVLHRWEKIRKDSVQYTRVYCTMCCLLRVSNQRENNCKASLMMINENPYFDNHHPATKLILFENTV